MNANNGVGSAKAAPARAIGLSSQLAWISGRFVLLPVPLRGEADWNARLVAWASAA